MEFIRPESRSRAIFEKISLFKVVGTFLLVILTLLAVFIVLPNKANAGQATLNWDTVADSDVKGYKVFYGTASGDYTHSVDVGNTASCTINSLTDGQTYYFAAVAYDAYGNQSIYSNETSKTIITAPNSYTISALASTGGSISPSGTTTVSSGNTEIFTITPSSGYKIAQVTVDGTSVGAVSNYTFSNVTANHVISATFIQNAPTYASYTINATVGSRGGTISPTGTTTVSTGTSKTYIIKADSKYKINYVLIDGRSVGAVNAYTFSNITANHTITVYFARIR